MKNRLRDIVLLVLMIAAAVLALALRPTEKLADQGQKMDLESMVPHGFGDWQELQQKHVEVINPQQVEQLSKLYAQTLSRSYINNDGVIIMLSIAYGTNQSDGVALHYPEVCYPAQGFQLLANESAKVETDYGNIRVRHLVTRLGDRYEPVTYWSTLGNQVVQGSMETKIAQLKYGFRGQIPDGLIFRVSSISRDANQGYEAQSRFVRDLVKSLSNGSRLRLTGLAG